MQTPRQAANSESEQREHIRTQVHENADDAVAVVAAEIADLIRSRAAEGRAAVLGLATGSTPVRLYRELIRLHREERLSFQNVITFNLDEYYGLPRTHPESYWRFMREQLFDHIDIPDANVNVPDGRVPRSEVFAWCQAYEQKIRDVGGIDLQVLGIGRTGHIGFNEPGSGRDSRTRIVTLDRMTRGDAARDFLGEANVPRHAITMGVGTILDARRVVLLAWGEAKARVIAHAAEDAPTDALPASFLQAHPDACFLIDQAAAGELTRIKRPWLVGSVEWTPALIRRAVVWLSIFVKKPVLKLLDEDYSEHGMADLLTEHGPAYGLNIRIFNELQHTITGWPGGKPGADDSSRPERAAPHPKRALVLSPEPLDDVLGMGGTLRRLVEQGHRVTVGYQTSGNLAVPDEEVALATDLVFELSQLNGGPENTDVAFAREARRQLDAKSELEGDTPEIRRFKSIIRRGEARAALEVCGLEPARARFLDLPFYEKGKHRQFRIGEDDVAKVANFLRELQPHQIFATGERDDPSSVAAVCFEILRRALTVVADESWTKECRIWLYRSPDKEWETAAIDMAVPFSPRELASKIQAIYHHKTQRSQSPLDAGLREIWQQAEHSNREIARTYDRLGLAEYEAIEAFQRFRF